MLGGLDWRHMCVYSWLLGGQKIIPVYTITGNLAGIPGISMPCGQVLVSGKRGKSSGGSILPIDMQLLGKHYDEANLLRLAFQFEHAGGCS